MPPTFFAALSRGRLAIRVEVTGYRERERRRENLPILLRKPYRQPVVYGRIGWVHHPDLGLVEQIVETAYPHSWRPDDQVSLAHPPIRFRHNEGREDPDCSDQSREAVIEPFFRSCPRNDARRTENSREVRERWRKIPHYTFTSRARLTFLQKRLDDHKENVEDVAQMESHPTHDFVSEQ